MATDNVTRVRIGTPGPPGAGVTAAEKATFVTLTAANVFTNTNEVRVSNTAALVASSGALTTDRSLVIDTTNKEIELWNGAKLKGFSDAGGTQKAIVDMATGYGTFIRATITDPLIGDPLWWDIEMDGGGSALTTGLKRRIKIPYGFLLEVDPVDGHFWQVALDQVGSIGLDLWMDTYAAYPPTNADRISGTVGTQNPRVAAAIKNGSGTTTGWTLQLVGGRYLFVNIDTVATATWATLSLYGRRTA